MLDSVPIFFIHIPKTSGTAFRGLLRAATSSTGYFSYPGYLWAKEYLENIEEIKKEKFILFEGHVPFSATKQLNMKFRYATILRNPIERCVSHWKHIVRQVDENISLDEFINDKKFSKLVTNYQAKYLGFSPKWKNFVANSSQEHHELFEYMDMNMSDIDLFLKCISILNKFVFIGIKELFFESTVVAKKLLSIDIQNAKTKVTDYTDILTLQVVEQLTERNKVDMAIYNYAFQRMLITMNDLKE